MVQSMTCMALMLCNSMKVIQWIVLWALYGETFVIFVAKNLAIFRLRIGIHANEAHFSLDRSKKHIL